MTTPSRSDNQLLINRITYKEALNIRDALKKVTLAQNHFAIVSNLTDEK